MSSAALWLDILLNAWVVWTYQDYAAREGNLDRLLAQ